MPVVGIFSMEYAGVTNQDAMYDYGALGKAWKPSSATSSRNAYNAPSTIVPGKVLDILDVKLYQWPGHGVAKEREYQFVEGEYMKRGEYQDLIDDPTGFFSELLLPPDLRYAQNRFETFPLIPPVNEIPILRRLQCPLHGGAEGGHGCPVEGR